MIFEKVFRNEKELISTRGVCNACSYNSGTHSLFANNKIIESSYSSRNNTMRNVEKQGKGCPS